MQIGKPIRHNQCQLEVQHGHLDISLSSLTVQVYCMNPMAPPLKADPLHSPSQMQNIDEGGVTDSEA